MSEQSLHLLRMVAIVVCFLFYTAEGFSLQFKSNRVVSPQSKRIISNALNGDSIESTSTLISLLQRVDPAQAQVMLKMEKLKSYALLNY